MIHDKTQATINKAFTALGATITGDVINHNGKCYHFNPVSLTGTSTDRFIIPAALEPQQLQRLGGNNLTFVLNIVKRTCTVFSKGYYFYFPFENSRELVQKMTDNTVIINGLKEALIRRTDERELVEMLDTQPEPTYHIDYGNAL